VVDVDCRINTRPEFSWYTNAQLYAMKMLGYRTAFVCETFFANNRINLVQINGKWKSMTITWSAAQRANRLKWRLEIADAIEGVIFYI
jgi:hypothetical protein